MIKAFQIITPSKCRFPVRFRLARQLLGNAEPYFHRDELSELPTRAAPEDITQNEIGFAVLFIDLDDFKLVNDRLGYTGGDNVLKQVAEKSTHYVRKNDSAVRWGGDKFVLVMHDTSTCQGAQIANWLHSLLVTIKRLPRQELSLPMAAQTLKMHDQMAQYRESPNAS